MSLREDVERLFAKLPVVVGIDFDGTLAPIAPRPDLARPDLEGLRLLARLASKPGIVVVVLSGRARADLEERLGEIPEGVILIGGHGSDFGGPAESDPVIESAAAMVEKLASSVPGAFYEIKPHSVAFHYRQASGDRYRPALEELRRWAELHPGVHVMEGKEVIELSTSSRTKGDAIKEIAGDAGILYVGDDLTDETVFQVLRAGDVGVKVGVGETSASHRVPDVAAVVELLRLVDLISG